ncbi:glycoside hydrolase family 3 N-terminal domain-containing protein [Candidatus Halobonum tyrrellensis]|uniref:beta-glucosidase n=1 Tax=Candidatus Halobonum tyrrellensis G22 TaxID=1324957 RepID=V4IV34_9EURY|nr:glycoside hydrolase family 3 N-terminal domain-containing protein [Candidatus Halobonum tyrrellensis]ESP87067.1 glycoside hydrolase family 3 domain protein [Candidatus Halobonum tyrrellensis G22]
MVTRRFDHQVEELLERMTLEEKVGQMVGTPPHEDVAEMESEIRDHHVGSVHFGGTPHNTPEAKAEVANAAQRVAVEESRLGVPVFLRAMAEHGHAAVAGSTVFPQQLGMAATRNPDLAREAASVAATEMRATGVQSTSSPIGDVARDQRWGRIAETFGESPYLSARMTAAMVEGYQGDDPSDPESVLAVTKHFPMYSEGVRGEDTAPNEVSTYTMRRVHVPPYQAGIDAGTGGVMPCYNSINGEPVHGSKRILTGLLREELGFEGFVLADYRGAEDLHRAHDTTADLEQSIWQSVSAGMDLLPSGGSTYTDAIVNLVESGELSERRVEESARRVLRAKFELGLFDDPYVDVDEATRTLGSDDHREIARRVARETMTLLKNDDDVLPLSPDLGEVLVTGPNADDIAHQHGGWGNVRDPDPMGDTVLDGIEAAVGDDTTVTHEPGSGINEAGDVDAAADAAADADAAVVVLGEPDYVHEFSRSTLGDTADEFPKRTQLTLPDAQLDLAKAVHETGTPTVVVFVTGRVLATPWVAEHVPGVLMAYQPGSEGGAVADVLFGAYNPHGKLPISVPRSEGQVPVRFNYLPHPRHHGAEESHVDSYDPLFAYGHGLSYTEFAYDDLTLSAETVGPGDTVDAEVTVTNAGERAGVETVEVFVRDVLSSRVTPVRELAGFARVELDAGETDVATVPLAVEDAGVIGDDGDRTPEAGTHRVFAGDLSAEFDVERRYS